MNRHVVITGLGAVSPVGLGAARFFGALGAGAVGIRRIQAFDPGGFPCQIAGEVAGYSARDYLPRSYRKAVKVMARDTELAIGAADFAIRDAGLTTKAIDESRVDVDPARMAVHVGAGTVCTDLTELGQAVWHATEEGAFSLARWGSVGMNHLPPLWLLQSLPNMLGGHISIIHDAQGPSNAIMCGTAGGHLAIGESFRTIERGDADIGLAGGAESQVNPMGLLRQCLLQRVTTSRNDDPSGACRPFDEGRDGMIIGEGGGLVVLEEEQRARGRKAHIYAEVLGFAALSSAYSLRDPEPDGQAIAGAIRRAMAEAKVTPEEIDLVVPHGTGIPAHDLSEARALHAALGSRAGQVPVWPIMGQIGNTGAASGGLALIAALMGLHTGQVPAAVNCPRPDPACGLAIVRQPLAGDLRTALVFSYALGVQTAAIVVKKVASGQ